MSVDQRKVLDAQICHAIAAFEEAPDPADVALTTLQLMAPHIAWPSVPGDNQTIVALQSMVVFRVDQVATEDPAKSAQENLADFCKPGFDTHPAPQPEPDDAQLPHVGFDPAPGG